MDELNRIYARYAYDTTDQVPSYWQATCNATLDAPRLNTDRSVDVAIIGAGYTGLNAALRLARGFDREVAVLEAGAIGWGASGRNGGFCGYGGSKLSDAKIVKKYGPDQLEKFYDVQHAGIEAVRLHLDTEIAADKTLEGELCLAHSRLQARYLTKNATGFKAVTGLEGKLLSHDELKATGQNADHMFGGLVYPKGFGIHPLKYVIGLARLAYESGASLYAHTPAIKIERLASGTFSIRTKYATLLAKTLLIATNGYSAENLPDGMKGRYLPVVSHIMVTDPIPDAILQVQGWTSQMLAFDTRTLLHYFRLLPDKRLLFGMRGTADITPRSMRLMKSMVRRDFDQMFPCFRTIPTAYHWGGLVCLTRSLTPFIGTLAPGLHAAFGYHGNGIAMGTYAGQRAADDIAGADTVPSPPDFMRKEPGGFPIAPLRRKYLPLAYFYYGIMDRI